MRKAIKNENDKGKIIIIWKKRLHEEKKKMTKGNTRSRMNKKEKSH